MSNLRTEHIFNGSIEAVFSGITKYQEYPKYLPGVTKIELLPGKTANAVCCARYELNIVKTFYYTLEMFQEAPAKIWWHLVESNLMKHNSGSWELKAQGKTKTKAIYSLDVKFKGLVPSALTDQIAKANLPQMMDGFQRLIDGT